MNASLCSWFLVLEPADHPILIDIANFQPTQRMIDHEEMFDTYIMMIDHGTERIYRKMCLV